ncbi:MAG: TM2 domain-containing protein [Pseudomonadota bacterium]
MQNVQKSTAFAYLMWFLLGPFGGHRFYLNRPLSALGMIIVFVAAAGIALSSHLGFLTVSPKIERLMAFTTLLLVSIWLLWTLADAVLIPGMVNMANGGRRKTLPAHQQGEKSTLTAYLMWLFLGAFSAHRFYLGRSMAGLMLLIAFLAGAAITIYAGFQPIGNSLYAGLALLAIAAAAWVVDLILIPGMVETHNDRLSGEDRKFAAQHGALEPGHQATARAAGLSLDDPDRPRKSAIPADYVLPWRNDAERNQQERWNPGDD